MITLLIIYEELSFVLWNAVEQLMMTLWFSKPDINDDGQILLLIPSNVFLHLFKCTNNIVSLLCTSNVDLVGRGISRFHWRMTILDMAASTHPNSCLMAGVIHAQVIQLKIKAHINPPTATVFRYPETDPSGFIGA